MFIACSNALLIKKMGSNIIDFLIRDFEGRDENNAGRMGLHFRT